MKRTKLILSALTVLASAVFAVLIVTPTPTAAQKATHKPTATELIQAEPLTLTRATSIRNVQKIRTELLEGIDAALNDPSARGGETTFVNTKVYGGAVDKTIYKTTNASAKMAAISETDLKGLRDVIDARFTEAIDTHTTNSLGNAKLGNSFFTGKLPVEQRKQ
jgi:hypothetical protein